MEQNEIRNLQHQIVQEAAAMLRMTSTAEITESERAINLIGEAWSLPAEDTLEELDLLRRERDAARKIEAGEAVERPLSETEVMNNATGMETLEMVWGLFETSLRLDSYDKRGALFDMAQYLAMALNLEDNIIKAEDEDNAECLEEEPGAPAEGEPEA